MPLYSRALIRRRQYKKLFIDPLLGGGGGWLEENYDVVKICSEASSILAMIQRHVHSCDDDDIQISYSVLLKNCIAAGRQATTFTFLLRNNNDKHICT